MKRTFEGWKVTAACALAVAIVCGAALLIYGTGEEGLRSGVRATARTSVAIFLVVFAASSLNALARAPLTKWMLRNRKHLGLGLAVSHFTHAAFLVALMARVPEFRADFSVSDSAGGLTTYAFLLAMTVTSFDGPKRRLGPRAWKVLHKAGMYALWALFTASYVIRVDRVPVYYVPLALLVGALALRAYVRLRRRNR
ncbi:MAG TPA: ferric reductase-like transmembrane domain-containing protein [Kofleriaceae bacterium]|nr:ferric reductase-like transmembrane domain-containing protein [Kofleriaceae bacterium]